MRLFEIDKRSRSITSTKNVLSQIEKNCSQSLNAIKNNQFIFKGMRANGDLYLTNPAKIERISRNTTNYYTMILSNLPSWKEYPKRNRSIICTNCTDKAKIYGNIYLVIPFDNANFGICPKKDIWDSKINNRWYMSEMNDVWNVYGADSSNLKIFLNDLSNGSYQEYEKASLLGLRKKLQANSMEVISKLYDPTRLKFRHGNILILPKIVNDIDHSHELWTDSRCYLVRYHSFLFDSIKIKYNPKYHTD